MGHSGDRAVAQPMRIAALAGGWPAKNRTTSTAVAMVIEECRAEKRSAFRHEARSPREIIGIEKAGHHVERERL